MRWTFDGVGSWRAASKFSDEGITLMYRIFVCDDGGFSVNRSDDDLFGKVRTFPTLDAAKAFCVGNERDIEAEGKL